MATEFRCGGRFYSTVFRSLSANPKVKELLKSVHICQSYRKSKSGTFFMANGVYSLGLLTTVFLKKLLTFALLLIYNVFVNIKS